METGWLHLDIQILLHLTDMNLLTTTTLSRNQSREVAPGRAGTSVTAGIT